MIGLHEAASNEQDIPDPDVPALCLGPDVDALVFATLIQLFEADGVVVVWIVLDTLLVGISAVIKQDTPARDAMFGPVMDGAFVVGLGTEDVFAVGVVVEGPGWDVGELAIRGCQYGGTIGRGIGHLGRRTVCAHVET